MPEETTQATQEAQASTTETTAADSQTAEQTGAAGTGEQSQTTEAKATETAPASTGDKSKANGQSPKEQSKPISRRSAQFRIQQLAGKVRDLTQQKTEPTQEGEGELASQDNPDVAKLVADEVERRLNPIVSEHSAAADNSELNELFTGDKASERTKYEQQLRDMWKLPQYKDVAASDLYKIVSFDDAVKAATDKAIEEYKKAEKEARDNSGSGNSNTNNRTGNGAKSPANMTPQQLQEHNNRVKAGIKP